MKEGLEKDIKKENTQIKDNRDSVPDNGKKKAKEERPATKVVVRRLPPTMTEESFVEQVSPLPPTDYMYFVQADMSLSPHCFSRAYINFINQEDLFVFTQKFDNYVFLDSKGLEYPAVVEFAPFQRIPKHRPNRKKDPKMGTLESDPVFIAFKERLEAEILENKSAANAVKQHFFETSAETSEKKEVITPLLEFIRNRRIERQRIREEKREEKRKKDLERRRVKDEQRKSKKDDENPLVKVLHSPVVNKEKLKDRDTAKTTFTKKRTDELKSPKDKSSSETRSRESKSRIGKSYQEERLRQAERREELKKKATLSRSHSSLSESKTSLNEQKDENEKAKTSQTEEKPTSERKAKDTERRNTDRSYRKDEARKSKPRPEGRRDVEENGKRRNGKTNEPRSYYRKDDDKKDDYSRKKSTDGKKSSENSNSDKYKEKYKGKLSSRKSVETDDTEKHDTSNLVQDNENDKDKNVSHSADKEITVNDNLSDTKSEKPENRLNPEPEIDLKRKETIIQRRKSLESVNISNETFDTNVGNKNKKRRNSCDSPNNRISENSEIKIKNKTISFDTTITNVQNETNSEQNQNKTELSGQAFDSNEDMPKRRKSLEERRADSNEDLPNAENKKVPNRRNSLGSGDQRKHSERFKKQPKSDSKEEECGENKQRDPRTARRIRNKDRPTLEIYRPGMGRFSKQRLEREKILGSSTEVESPSSSPSPTPLSKSKPVSTKDH